MLRSGSFAVDITPPGSVYLTGYPHVNRMSTGVHDPLLASAVCLESGGITLLLIALDILFFSSDTAARIRKKLCTACGIKPEHILVSATHTHSGPLTIEMLSFAADSTVPGVNHLALEILENGAVTAGKKAWTFLQPSEFAVTSAVVRGAGCNRHDPKGPADPEIGIIVMRRMNDKKISAISLVYCMHPTVLHEDSTLISSDFPGAVRCGLTRKLQSEPVICWYTGPEGNQSPRYHVTGQTFAESNRLGCIIADAVSHAIDQISDTGWSNDIVLGGVIESIVPVRRTFPGLTAAQANLAACRNEYERLKASGAGHGPVRTAECAVFGAEETLYLCARSADGTIPTLLDNQYAALGIQVLKIGNIFLAAFPGELFVEYSLALKERFPWKSFRRLSCGRRYTGVHCGTRSVRLRG